MRIFHISFLCLICCLSFGVSVSADENIHSEEISQNTVESETEQNSDAPQQEDV